MSYEQTIPYILDALETATTNTGNVIASATQTQGQQQLVAGFTDVTIVGTDLDVVTLPSADGAQTCIIKNSDTGQKLQVYPASSDSIDSESVDASIVLEPQQIVWFWSISASSWITWGRTRGGADSYSASATQTQAGGTAITTEIADVNVVTAHNDAVTLFGCFYGAKCWVINTDTTQDLQVFPALGNVFGDLPTDDPIILTPQSSCLFFGVTNARWELQQNYTARDGITANATQTQGQTPVPYGYIRISIVGTNGDVVTLPTAFAGASCELVNDDTAQYAQVYPASGDSIDGAAADQPIKLWPGQTRKLIARNSTDWRTVSKTPGHNAAVTAFAGGGQASATLLEADVNRIATVVSNGDSVKLPVAKAGLECWVYNDDSAQSTDCFPNSGDRINDLANDTALSIAADTGVIFKCMTTALWNTF